MAFSSTHLLLLDHRMKPSISPLTTKNISFLEHSFSVALMTHCALCGPTKPPAYLQPSRTDASSCSSSTIYNPSTTTFFTRAYGEQASDQRHSPSANAACIPGQSLRQLPNQPVTQAASQPTVGYDGIELACAPSVRCIASATTTTIMYV